MSVDEEIAAIDPEAIARAISDQAYAAMLQASGDEPSPEVERERERAYRQTLALAVWAKEGRVIDGPALEQALEVVAPIVLTPDAPPLCRDAAPGTRQYLVLVVRAVTRALEWHHIDDKRPWE
jgi:hypothetical protein